MAKTAQIFIDGEILPEGYIWDDDGTSLYRVRKQIEAAGDFDRIRLNIFSPGGYCLEGWAIHDYLIGLGKPIDTYAYGQCASFGTVFHTMGEDREISPNCDYVIHRPWDFFMGNDIQIDEANANLKKETLKLFGHYAVPTGMTTDELAAFVREKDIKLSPQETVDKNFSTRIYQPTNASVRASMQGLKLKQPSYLMSLKDRKPNPNAPKESFTNSQNTMAEQKKSLMDAAKSFLAFLAGEETKALDVPLKDGRKIVTNSTGDDPVVGDTAQIDGVVAPDGDYPTENDKVITVVGGVITAIEDADDSSDNQSADPDASTADIVALRKENETLKAQVQTLTSRQDEVERRTRAVLGQLISEEVPTQANRIVTPKSGKPQTDEQADRDEMLAGHAAKFAKKTPAKA